MKRIEEEECKDTENLKSQERKCLKINPIRRKTNKIEQELLHIRTNELDDTRVNLLWHGLAGFHPVVHQARRVTKQLVAGCGISRILLHRTSDQI